MSSAKRTKHMCLVFLASKTVANPSGVPVTKYIEEASLLADAISRNVLSFLKIMPLYKAKLTPTSQLDLEMLSCIISKKTELLIQSIMEDSAFKSKLSDIDGVSLEEINEISKRVNIGVFEELSMKQRQQLYVHQIGEKRVALEKRIKTLFYMVEVSTMLLVQYGASSLPLETAKNSIAAIESLRLLDVVIATDLEPIHTSKRHVTVRNVL
jgi:hypothetical protein